MENMQNIIIRKPLQLVWGTSGKYSTNIYIHIQSWKGLVN